MINMLTVFRNASSKVLETIAAKLLWQDLRAEGHSNTRIFVTTDKGDLPYSTFDDVLRQFPDTVLFWEKFTCRACYPMSFAEIGFDKDGRPLED